MSEYLEPVVRLRIEAVGYDGEEWNGSGTPADLTLFPEHARAAVEHLRAAAVERLDYKLQAAALLRRELDFSVPNQPMREDIELLVRMLDGAREAAQVLAELAPFLAEDDDDAGAEPQPEPTPDAGGVGNV